MRRWCFFFSSRRRHTRYIGDWSSDVCSSDLAPSHVHAFLYRLDFDIDGQENVVEEFNREVARGPGGDTPAARCTWTAIRKEGGRPLRPETFRSWRVVNPRSKNALGHPRSYQL